MPESLTPASLHLRRPDAPTEPEARAVGVQMGTSEHYRLICPLTNAALPPLPDAFVDVEWL